MRKANPTHPMADFVKFLPAGNTVAESINPVVWFAGVAVAVPIQSVRTHPAHAYLQRVRFWQFLPAIFGKAVR